MNTHMYSHPFTAEHLQRLEQNLGYLISGPQGAGMLACGDEGEHLPVLALLMSGPGKMTDWRDIVDMIETFSKVFHLRSSSGGSGTSQYPLVPTVINPSNHRRKSIVITPSMSLKSKGTVDEEQNKPVRRYTGELDASGATQKSIGQSRDEASTSLQWRDIWPE